MQGAYALEGEFYSNLIQYTLWVAMQIMSILVHELCPWALTRRLPLSNLIANQHGITLIAYATKDTINKSLSVWSC